jgi:putative nucleotidyltransferase with HDIG domain
MEIICPQCRKRYRLPDERLPWGSRLVIHCPSCKGLLQRDLPPERTPSALPPSQAPLREQAGPKGALLRKQILSHLKNLPAMPQVLQQARRMAHSAQVGMRELAAVLESDPALAARILKLANSAYYGFSGRIATVNQAALLLGVETLMATVLLVGMAGLLGRRLDGYRLPSGRLWRHSLAVAVAARRLAAAVSPSLEDDAFSAGLLHDVGKLVLDRHLAERQAPGTASLGDPRAPWVVVERELLGLEHASMAAEICRLWHFPARQVSAVGQHHRPLQATAEDRPLASIVHLADALCITVDLDSGRPPGAPDDGVLAFLQLDAQRTAQICDGLAREVAEIAERAG